MGAIDIRPNTAAGSFEDDLVDCSDRLRQERHPSVGGGEGKEKAAKPERQVVTMYKMHFKGWSKSHDEWVLVNRLFRVSEGLLR